MKWAVVIGTVALCGTVGCGSNTGTSDNAGTSSSSKATTEGQTAQAAQTAAQGMDQLAKGLQQLAQNQNVTVIDSSVLKDLLPDVPGWEKSRVANRQIAMPVSMSTAEARYAKGDASVKVTITDTALSQIILSPFTMMIAAGYKEESDDGWKRSQQIGGYPGWEEWQKGSKHAESHAVIGNRFVVDAEADDVPNTETSRQFVQAVNLAKLAGLK